MALILTLNALQGLGVVVGIPAVRARLDKRCLDHGRSVVRTLAGPLVVVAAVAGWFTYIFYTHSLLEVGTGLHVGGTVYGDMPFHLNIINSFLHGANRHATLFTGFQAVFFADAGLVYPFIPDWHVAVLVAAGRWVCSLLPPLPPAPPPACMCVCEVHTLEGHVEVGRGKGLNCPR
jgi:hypothetical protein